MDPRRNGSDAPGLGAGGGRPPAMPSAQETYYSSAAHRVLTPLSWEGYFDSKHTTSKGFTYYRKGTTGPNVLLLHGGGHSALSYACFAKLLSELSDCQIVAYDARGHGATQVTEGSPEDLRLDRQVQDCRHIAEEALDSAAKTIIIGHSMGGGVAAHAAHGGFLPNLAAAVVIDVVEGTALDALSGMKSFLRSRPASFASEEEAIKWSIRSGQLRNTESARISMPAQVRLAEEGEAEELEEQAIPNTIVEEEEEEEENEPGVGSDSSRRSGRQQEGVLPPEDVMFAKPQRQAAPAEKQPGKYVWRVDLVKSAPYWQEWFEGLSSTFLRIPALTMLMLAGVDRLDKELTIGQMQGKFQLQLMANCGHSVHEDAPGQAAAAIADFLARFKLATRKHPA
ncbi:uncharacterized protein MONBRDRAFT_35614 [Monosiga brevicollis MX1]|uniref:Protein phosphatase methylesterase 1 n=1 Tax=Monosiga brevicollis TaxID=81824 RepID=A9UQA7_MONBE|nr:uncharacterized protein MONBRDRAFT_35614 [Monosiga brevicollis MX1]EDQ92563.1 predicted protein [Monosiga brevicollis MX1]|eukprot:XP_001742325.1 hypothetical protein [Monosiga brevicollis MX1]